MGDLVQLAREDPDAVRSVAKKADDELAEWLQRILEEAEGSR